MTPQTGSHPGNALTPQDILRHEVLRHARAAYRHAKEGIPADETPEHLKLAQASTPEAQEDDDEDKAALWLPSGTGAGATAEAAAMTEAGAAAGTAGTIGTTAATGSALLGPSILGAFAVAGGVNLHDNSRVHDLSARNRLSNGRDSSREETNTGTEAQSSAAAPSADTAPLATGTAPTAPSRPTNEGTQAEASRTPAVADAAAAASTEPATPSAPDTPTADASKSAEGGEGSAMPQVKPLPTYSENASVSYAHGENKPLGAAVFSGTNEETAPAFVRITAIQGKDGEAAANTMSLKDGEALTAGSVVSRADFDKVVWDASKNEGGSFSFIPVQDAQGTTLPGALEQTVSINEAPALPSYEADVSVAYTYNQSKAVGADIFNGTDSATAPAFVRITAIQGKDGEAAANTMSLQGGDALTVGSVVSRTDFDKVIWDASKNEGGSFKFIPVQDAQGTALPGAVEKSVTIQEGPALPTYEADMSVAYTYNQNKAVGADIFNGTDSATAPAFVRITAIQGKDGEAAANAMSLKDGDALTVGSVVSRADFDKVIWDASKNEGGSFKFIPVQDAQGTALPGAVEQTVSINEARPLYHIAAENFDLLDAYPDRVNEHPAYVQVTNIVEANDTNGILDALVLGEDGGTVLKVGDIIRAEDFGRVYWNHASNDGGEIFLATYNAEGRLIDPGRYSMELEPSWKNPDKKSLPAPHHEQEATDASPELVGVAHPATDGLMPLGAQAQYPDMTPLSMSSTALLDSVLEQHPGTTGLL